MWSNFYDDFVTFALSENTSNTEATVGLLFDLLGWNYATEGDKACGFDLKFSALASSLAWNTVLTALLNFAIPINAPKNSLRPSRTSLIRET